MLEAGTPAPDFTAPRDGGDLITLSALRPKAVVLYFYPKDNTPGCTMEALDFTALRHEFAAAGAVVIGVSRDSVAKHEKFCAKHDLGIPLVSDEDGAICEAYGTWGEKVMLGRRYMGIHRATFLIDGSGQIARVWPKVKVKGHASEVLEALRAL